MTGPLHRIASYISTALWVACAVTHAETYTLPELVDMALKSSREIEMLEEEMLKTDAQIMEAKGGALPTISLSANYGYQFKQASFLGGEGFGSGMGVIDSNMFRAAMESPADTLLANTILGLTRGLDFDPDAFQTPKNSLALGISLEQALFAQGKVSVGLKIAKTYKRTLNCRYVAQRQKTVADVTNLFNGCLLARENTAIAQEAVSLAQRSHELAITRASLGDGTALDTLNARYNLETAMLSLRKFQERQRSAYAALAQAVGRESEDTPLEIEGELKEQSFDYTLEEAMDTMHANNKKIGELQGTAGVQELLVKLGKTDYLPLVFAGASVTRINMFDDILDEGWFTDEQYDSKVYVGATLTLFDGTKREQKLRQAQADYRIFEQQRAEAIDKLELALRDTYGKYQSNRANVRSARTLRDLAQRGYDVAAEMYEAQALSQLELRQKELDLNNARLALNAALYELQSTIISLQLLMGTLPLSEQGT